MRQYHCPSARRWHDIRRDEEAKGKLSRACSISEHELIAVGGYSGEECVAECEILGHAQWQNGDQPAPLTQPRAFGAAVGSGQVRRFKHVSSIAIMYEISVHPSIMDVWASTSTLLLIALAGKALPMPRVQAPDMAGRVK